MPSCILKTCGNHSKKNKKNCGVTYHRFPCPGHEKREEWISVVKKNRNDDTWLPNNSTVICSDHFINEDKNITKTGRTYLKKYAVPYDDKNSKSGTSEVVDPLSEQVSCSGSICNTRETILKDKLSRELTATKALAIKFKKIQLHNRHLKKKCESYELMIKDMKNKFGMMYKQNIIS